MKTNLIDWFIPRLAMVALAVALVFLAGLVSSCTTVTEKITSPDGTITERTTSSVDAAAFTAGANAVTAIAAPRAVIAEK